MNTKDKTWIMKLVTIMLVCFAIYIISALSTDIIFKSFEVCTGVFYFFGGMLYIKIIEWIDK